MVLYRRESKRACRTREFLSVNKQNRIIIRNNNSLQLLNRILVQPVLLFSVECMFYVEQLSLSKILIESYLVTD